MAIGDLIFQLMGQSNPREELAAALAGPQPLAQAQPGVATPPAAAGGPATAPAAGAAPPPDPTPQAYKSPPDLMQLYTRMLERQEKNAGIDRGLGLIASAFAQPANRPGIMAAMTGQQTPDVAADMGNLMKVQNMQQAIMLKAKQRQNLPAIAKKYGLDLDTAQYLFDADKLDDVIAQAEKGETSPPDVKEYKFYAQQETQQGRQPMPFGEWSQSQHKARTKYALQPQYTIEKQEDGTEMVKSWQLSDSGGMQEVKTEDGKPLVKPLQKVDTPTEIQFRNPFTGEVVRSEPKDLQKAKDLEETGKQVAELRVKLPGTREVIKSGLQTIKEIEEDTEGLSDATGWSGYIMPYIPESKAKNVQTKIDKLQGQAFLTAFETLKGGGAISEAEGIAATSAISRLKEQGVSTEDYKAAILELKGLMQKGILNAYEKIGQPVPDDIKEFMKSMDTPSTADEDALVDKYLR